MDYVPVGLLGFRIERAIHAKYIIIGGIIATIILWMGSVILHYSLTYPALLVILVILLPIIRNYENGLRNQQRRETLDYMKKQIRYPGGE